jgi:tight adherence protein B
MGILLGLFFGLGLILIIRTFLKSTPKPEKVGSRTVSQRLEELLAQAGVESVTPGQLLGACIGVGLTIFIALLAISRAWPIALLFGFGSAYVPMMLVRMRARARRQELRELWPDVVDNLASSVRAGLSLGEALTQIGTRGPDALRRPFQRFAEEYRATGRFNDCLDALKSRLADPVGDRIIESIRLAREVGGSDLGRLLRTLSAFLRDDIRTRSELEARQSFTVNGARVAIATPFAVLIFMAFQPDLVAAYNSFAGFIVLGIGVGLMLLAYRIMLRIGRLPEERRVLR